jgi:glycosyltransferase involved in cell wall biosynthesis
LRSNSSPAAPSLDRSLDWPSITIVTPCKDRPEYLEEAIESVLSQDYPRFEYIVVDGGSSDQRVFDILRRYEDRLAWWLSEPDSGHGEAIGKGFARSSGEILGWLCSDDCLEPGALRAVGQAFRDHPEVDVIYGNAFITDARGTKTAELRAVPFNRYGWVTAGSVHQASVFWRRGIYERAGGMDLEYSRYATDHELFLRFIRCHARFLFMPVFLSSFRQHGDQTTEAASASVHEYAWRAMRRHMPLVRFPGTFHALRMAMRLRKAYWHVKQGEMSYLLDRKPRASAGSDR